MSSRSAPAPLRAQGFKQLNQAVSVYEPPSTSSFDSSAPDVVLFLSWLDAVPKHISKYTVQYQTLYPSARIVLVTISLSDIAWRPSAYVDASRLPALEMLLALPKNSKVLLHAFSNGGAITSTGLARAYKRTAGQTLPIQAMILDSTPGRAHWDTSIAAFEIGLPKQPVVRMVLRLLIRLWLVIVIVLTLVKFRKDALEVLREELNADLLFATDAKRLYFFSAADKMILDKDVKEHIEDARAKGWNVKTQEFSGTGHVSHMLSDAPRYWKAVEDVWNSRS